MAYKDSLTLYEEMVAKGIPDEQAKIMAHQQGSLVDEMLRFNKKLDDTIHEFNFSLNKMDSKLDVTFTRLETSMKWMRAIGAAMIVTFFANMWFIKQNNSCIVQPQPIIKEQQLSYR